MDEREWRVLEGVGLVLVRPADGDMIEVWEDPDDAEDSYLESSADLADALRPLLSTDRAEAIIDQLAAPLAPDDAVAGEQRLRSYQAAFADGSIDALVEGLRRLYQTTDVSGADLANLDRFEGALLPEIAQVLGTTTRTIRDRLRRATGDRVVPPVADAPDPPTDVDHEVLPTHTGWHEIGAFAVGAAIVAGDRPPLDARPGVWHAYYRLDEQFGLPCEVIVAHRDVSAQAVTLLDQTVRDRHRVLGGRGSMDICDAAVAEDRDWLAARFDSTDLSIVQGRGFWVYTEADGDHPGLVIEDGQALLVHITET